ncbi:MAG: hypothetical protein ACI4T5_08340 [Prevotella sp.]
MDIRSFNAKDLADKLRERYGSIAPIVIDDAFRIISDRLAEGYIVSLDRLGTFSLRLGIDKPEAKDFDDVRTQDVKFKGVRFNAAKEIRRKVGKQSIHKVKDPNPLISTTTTRWRVFLAQMLKDSDNLRKPLAQLPVTISLYRMYTGATDYTARKDLTALCAKGLLSDISTAHTKMYLIV